MMIHRKRQRWALFAGSILFSVAGAVARAAPAPDPYEDWAVVTIGGEEAGWAHQKTVSQKEGGKLQWKTETSLLLEFKRFGQSLSFLTEEGVVEDSEGRVLRMTRKAKLSDQETSYELVAAGSKARMTVTTMGTPHPSELPWQPGVLGPVGVSTLRLARGWKPGTRYAYPVFSFDHAKIITTTVEIVGPREIALLDGQKVSLQEACVTLDALPGVVGHEWMDERAHTQKESISMMGLAMEIIRTTRERAQRPGREVTKDVMTETMGVSNVFLPRPYQLDSVLYAFKAKDPKLGLPRDLAAVGQWVVRTDGKSAVVRIDAVIPRKTQKRPLANPQASLGEFLAPNPFVQSEDAKLREKALQVVGQETDAWKAGVLLEKFVHDHIREKNFNTAFASAAEVFASRSGDCSEHAVLLAALARAVGIPARVAMGYLYLGGIFGGHMWTEIWIQGEWYALDAVLGRGRVDPTHIRFSTSSLKDGGLGDAFTSALQGLGNLEIQVLEFRLGKQTVRVGKQFQDQRIEKNTYVNQLYGLRLTKPEGYRFIQRSRDFSGPDFTLLTLSGKSTMRL